MSLHELTPNPGSTRPRKRVGRGRGSGTGKTCGRGHKGARSRSGYSRRRGFEGGQMPLIRRVPKRGFTNIFRTEYEIVNLRALARLGEALREAPAEGPEAGVAGDAGPVVGPEDFLAARLVRRRDAPVKILGVGEMTAGMTVRAHAFSEAARRKIEAAGGSWEVLSR